jgi:hypothetical protein
VNVFDGATHEGESMLVARTGAGWRLVGTASELPPGFDADDVSTESDCEALLEEARQAS